MTYRRERGDHFVCDYGTYKPLLGPMSCQEAVAWIIAQGPLEKQAAYCNMSRYMLAKKGLYPLTKQGDADLEAALAAGGRARG